MYQDMSKRVKTFEEKQELTDSQIEAIKHLRNKTNNIPKHISHNVLTPDELKLHDIDQENKLVIHEGLITPEILESEKQEELQEVRRFTEEFQRQLEVWIEKDHHTEYSRLEFDHDDYLVRLFNMDITGFDGFKTLEYEWSPILKNFKLKDKPALENVFPIVKILKVGEGVKSDKYKVGDICLVPSTDVIGEDWNPKFLHIMQFQNSQNMKPVLPEGMRQSIPNVEKNWDRYKFVRPWIPNPEPIDHLTYLIPEPKIRGRYSKK